MDKELRFIGTVRSEIKERRQMPAFGAPAVVEIFPEFREALFRIEKHSHCWVLAWLMARPERDVLQVVPRGVREEDPQAMHGVFAVRSPARPNPIGLTAAKLVKVDGLRLEFDVLDFLDGTPVVDIKPYFGTRDLIPSATSVQVGRAKDRDAVRQSLLFQVERHVPERHPDVALAVRIMEHFRATAAEFRDPAEWQISAPASRPYLLDALMGLARVGFHNGMRLGDGVSINGVAYELQDGGLDYEQTLAAEDGALFVSVPTGDRG